MSQTAQQSPPEADCREGAIHPRSSVKIFGHDNCEKTVLEALQSGRMHHAWLIQGPSGIGKATFAYRIARFLLAGTDPSKAINLEVDQDQPAVRQVAAHSHPDLFVLRREWVKEKKKHRQSIAVDDVRKAISFFQHTAGAGGWRITIVDSMDDLNRNGANALLKTLEEPPDRALFLLISSSPGALPATIRSRCRRLVLAPLNDADMMSSIATGARQDVLGKLDNEARASLLALAAGSPGQAIDLVCGNGLQLASDIADILSDLPKLDYSRLHILAARLGRVGADNDFKLSLVLLRDWIAARVVNPPEGERVSGRAHLASAWEKIGHLSATSEAMNLDRRRTLLDAFNIVAAHYPA